MKSSFETPCMHVAMKNPYTVLFFLFPSFVRTCSSTGTLFGDTDPYQSTSPAPRDGDLKHSRMSGPHIVGMDEPTVEFTVTGHTGADFEAGRTQRHIRTSRTWTSSCHRHTLHTSGCQDRRVRPALAERSGRTKIALQVRGQALRR